MGDVDAIWLALDCAGLGDCCPDQQAAGKAALDRLAAALADERAEVELKQACLNGMRAELARVATERDEARARRIRTYKIARNLRRRVVAQRRELRLIAEEVTQVQRNREWAQEHAQGLRRERDEAKARAACDACAGSGKSISSLPCMCGGSGLAADAVTHLRSELWVACRERAEACADLATMTQDRDDWRAAVLALSDVATERDQLRGWRETVEPELVRLRARVEELEPGRG